jgi:ADP-ribose pyrophosphatase YjhB (NUDIX family)
MFPRGKVNEGESHEAAACREVLEEIGYDCTKDIRANEFIQYRETKLKQVTLFIIIGVEESFNFETRTRKEIGKIKWHDIKDIPLDKSAPGASKYKGIIKATKILRNWISGKKKQMAALNKKEKKQKKDKAKVSVRNESIESTKATSARKKQKNDSDKNTGGSGKQQRGKATANTFLDHEKIMQAFDLPLLKEKITIR